MIGLAVLVSLLFWLIVWTIGGWPAVAGVAIACGVALGLILAFDPVLDWIRTWRLRRDVRRRIRLYQAELARRRLRRDRGLPAERPRDAYTLADAGIDVEGRDA